MQTQENRNKYNPLSVIIVVTSVAFLIHPIAGEVVITGIILFLIKNPKILTSQLLKYFNKLETASDKSEEIRPDFNFTDIKNLLLQSNQLKLTGINPPIQNQNFNYPTKQLRLEKRKKYLQVALNSTLDEARQIISQIPPSDRILIEAGTPLIKEYGMEAISEIKRVAPYGSYIVADNKCADLGSREVEMIANAGANASTCLGVAPIETIDDFIEECEKFGIDSMIDMMNIESPLLILKKLKKLPDVVVLHRGVDESEFSKEKQIPYYQIKQIKGNFNILVSVAGGDTIKEVQRATFNDADIVVIWKSVYEASENTAKLIKEFLKEVK